MRGDKEDKDFKRLPKVVAIDYEHIKTTKYSVRKNLLHLLEKTIDVMANNLDCFREATKEAKRLINRINEES